MTLPAPTRHPHPLSFRKLVKNARPPRVSARRFFAAGLSPGDDWSAVYLSITLLILFCFVAVPSQAQLRQQTLPPTAQRSLPDVQATVDIPQAVPAFPTKSLAAPDVQGTLLPSTRNTPVSVSLDVLERAEWTTLDDGAAVARLRLVAPGAASMYLVFDDFWLPPGAQVFVYNEDQSFVRGAFTHQNNKPNGGFAIDFVPGETLILEYYVPRMVGAAGRLHLARVVRSPLPASAKAGRDAWKTTGAEATTSYTPTALPCSINTDCVEASAWADQARATVMVVQPDGGTCSGVLLNNTAEDGKAFILTAHHCGAPATGATYEDWIVRFDYESPSCENPTDLPSFHVATGVHVRVATTFGDFALLELMEAIPAEANVHLSGWSRSMAVPASAATIGHPAQDLKKITFEDASPQAYSNTYWRARFDRGCIEGGSSGSPLFNGDNGLMIGYVRVAAGMSEVCDGPGGDDNQADIWHGTFSLIWDVDVDGVSVADFLDPLGLNPESLGGAEAGISSLPVELTAFDATVDGADVLLRWATASETNNAGFEVQHRTDLDARRGTWQTLGFIDGMGTTIQPQQYGFRATDLASGSHTFRLRQVDYDGAFEYSPEVEVIIDLAETYVIEAAYPNPFNPASTLRFAVQQAQQVEVTLYNTLGQQVRTLYQGMAEAGQMQTVTIDGSGLPSGVYLVRVRGKRFTKVQTVTLAK